MTTQETFKRRIRARMAKTGERYGAARRVLIEHRTPADGGRTWVAEPEMGDDVIREHTGRGWDEWCDLIDRWPGHTDGHAAIVGHVAEQGVDGWWAQSVTVGYERITGLRVRHQRADGTFEASKSKTIAVDVDAVRAMLLDPEGRADLFPGFETELRSKPTTKSLRVAIGPGVALFDFAPRSDGRVTATVAHQKLPAAADVDEWKAYWSDWLDALDES